MFNWFKILNLLYWEERRWNFSKKTFTHATHLSSLEKLKEEILEIENDINEGKREPIEYVDALMCLFDSAQRNGIKPNEIISLYKSKVLINEKRKWVKNPDNTYSHVKK